MQKLWGSALYPSVDSLDFTETLTTVKDLQWFVRNPTSTIEVNPIVIADDNQTAFWTNGNGYGLANNNTQQKVGTDCLQVTNNAGTNGLWIYKSWGTGNKQNWSGKDIISFWMYGQNTGRQLTLEIDTISGVSNRYSFYITDNFTGWKKINRFLLIADGTVGSPDLSQIIQIQIYDSGSGGNPAGLMFDRLIVDVCPFIPVKKLSIDGLYLSNELEESPVSSDVLQIADDGQASFWTPANLSGVDASITLANSITTVAKGINALSLATNSTAQYGGIIYVYGSNQDFSAYDFVSFYFYGQNSGDTFALCFASTSTATTSSISPDYYRTTFIDNWAGWKRLVISLKAIGISGGSPSWSTIRKIVFRNETSSPSNKTWYLDRLVLQKGRWAFVEVAVPDMLYTFQNFLSSSSYVDSWLYWVLYSWNGSGYAQLSYLDVGVASANLATRSMYNYVLNGQTFQTIYGENQYNSVFTASTFISGLKGSTQVRRNHNNDANYSITYNGIGGCRRRIGFAIKMPPSDGTASSTTGINQCKLKLDVYVP